MRPRFLLIWGEGAAVRLRERLPTIETVLTQHDVVQGVSLFAAHGGPITPMPSVDGWVIGRLFRRNDPDPVTALPTQEQLAVASTHGRHLLKGFWGAYLAFWQDPGGSLHILRDPGAMQPALYHVGAGWGCCASDLDMLVDAGLVAPVPDWAMLTHYLLFPTLPAARSCVQDVIGILPGSVVSFGRQAVTERQVWVPGDFRKPLATPTASQATTRHLADTIDQCVAAWALCLKPAMLELSGGLDSSVIAASLSKSGIDWRALTIATQAADGDERSYARMVAETLKIDLDELRLDHHAVQPLAAPSRLTPTPGGMTMQRGFDAMVTDQMTMHGRAGLFSGTGGDNVFCLLSSSAPLLDAWQAGGQRLASRVLTDLARQTGATRFQVARHAARRWVSGLYRRRRWGADRLFLDPGLKIHAHAHPWLDLPRSAPQGHWGHIAMILRAHGVLDAHDRASRFPMIFPLLSQPVIEACLAIPSWHWIENGRDRSVARDAFAGRLPAPILARRRKGHLSTTIARAYERDRPALRELLCGGLLSGAGLLDRRSLEDFLARPVIHDDPRWFRVLELADAELWVRHLQRAGETCRARGGLTSGDIVRSWSRSDPDRP